MKYYIFDLDGTLADSRAYLVQEASGRTSVTTMSECSRSAWR